MCVCVCEREREREEEGEGVYQAIAEERLDEMVSFIEGVWCVKQEA